MALAGAAVRLPEEDVEVASLVGDAVDRVGRGARESDPVAVGAQRRVPGRGVRGRVRQAVDVGHEARRAEPVEEQEVLVAAVRVGRDAR